MLSRPVYSDLIILIFLPKLYKCNYYILSLYVYYMLIPYTAHNMCSKYIKPVEQNSMTVMLILQLTWFVGL